MLAYGQRENLSPTRIELGGVQVLVGTVSGVTGMISGSSPRQAVAPPRNACGDRILGSRERSMVHDSENVHDTPDE